jgi:hypothetical protein
MTQPTFDRAESASTAEELERAREELARRLDEACATPINLAAGETTGQLRRLDDALLAAARTAEEMITLKQKARSERDAVPPVAVAGPAAADANSTGEHVERIREFDDRNGCRWRAWAVIPGQASTTSTRNLGELRDGWLAFESISDTGKRRLAKYPADWLTLSDDQLETLLESAADAPSRKRAPAQDSPSPD